MQYRTGYNPEHRRRSRIPMRFVYVPLVAAGMTLAGLVGANLEKVDDIASTVLPSSIYDSGYNGEWVPYTAREPYLWDVAEKCPQNRDIRIWLSDIRKRNGLEGENLANFYTGQTIEIPKPCATR